MYILCHAQNDVSSGIYIRKTKSNSLLQFNTSIVSLRLYIYDYGNLSPLAHANSRTKTPLFYTFAVILNNSNLSPNGILDFRFASCATGSNCINYLFLAYRFVKDGQNPDQSPYDNLPDAAATYAVGGMATHWTAAVPRQHPKVERSSIIGDEEWQVLYEESEKLLNKSDDLFENSIRNTKVKKVLNDTYREEITEPKYLPQNLPLAGVRKKKEFVMWSGSNTILGEDLVKDIKYGDGDKIKLKVGECALVTRGGLTKFYTGRFHPEVQPLTL